MKNLKGGYQIVDLTESTTTKSVTISGTYDRFKNANGKALLIKTNDGSYVFSKVDEGALSTYSATYISGTLVYQVEVDSSDGVLLSEICDLEDVTPAQSQS